MNASTATEGELPEQPVDQEALWIRAVVSAALHHAELSAEESARILNVATAVPAAALQSVPPATPTADSLAARAHAPTVSQQVAVSQHVAVSPQPVVPPALPASPQAVVAPHALVAPLPALPPALRSSGSVSNAVARPDTSLAPDQWSSPVEPGPEPSSRSSHLALELIGLLVTAVVVAILLQQFALQAFVIPTASMETTVEVGDRVMVNKQSILFGGIDRGDAVVFEGVDGFVGGGTALLKRVVAAPGETIELRDDGKLWIWGADETAQDAMMLDEPYLDGIHETLAPPSEFDQDSVTIWHPNCVNEPSNPARCTLDSNSYFMMGDNRSQSFDSRGFGPIPEENIVGRAFLKIWPLTSISAL